MKGSTPTLLRPELLSALVAVLFLAAAPHLARVDLAISAFFGVMMLLRILGSMRPRLLPGKPLLVVATFVGFGNVFLHYPLLLGKRAGVALLISMLALKLLETRNRRDLYVGIFLGYFLLITQFLFHQSAELALYALVVATALTALMIEGSRHAKSASPLISLKQSGVMILQALPIMMALFFFFPRLSSPLWDMGYEANVASTGISDTLSPGSMSNLIRDDSVAFRANFDGEIPLPEKRYWRGPVFWQTDGHTWRDDRTLQQPFQPPLESSEIVDYSVILEPTDQPWLFTLDIPVTVPPNSLLKGDYQVVSDHSRKRRSSYEARSALEYNTGPIHPFDRRYALQLPDNVTPRMRELVADWRRDTATDLQLIARTLDYFRDEPFYYTLSPPLLDENPTDQFLFESRRGFCEHYATSFTLLMRIGGIPARVVGGYQGGEVNPVGNYLRVRQSDAHAWSEVWISGRGWIRIDPTAAVAPERVEQNFRIDPGQFNREVGIPVDFDIDLGTLDRLRQRINWGIDALSTSWNRWILGYSSRQQSKFLEVLGLGFLQGRRLAFGMIMITGLIVSILALAVWFKTRPKIDRIQSTYLRFCRKMARAGVPRYPWEGAIDYGVRIAARRPDLRAQTDAITRAYVELRYAPGDSTTETADYFRRVRRLNP